MKDFDAARKQRETTERSFTIGGQEFTYRAAVAPEALIDWNEAATGAKKLTEREWLELFDATIVLILDEGQEETWKTVRNPRAEHPLNLEDIREVLAWLIEQATGRPTGEPSGSSSGSSTTETESKDESSSPAAPASTT